MTYRYDGDAGYARMFRLLGLPTEVPAFQPGRNYSGIAAGVLDAVVHNAALTTTTFSGSPEKLPLTTMSAEKFREMTAKEQLDA